MHAHWNCWFKKAIPSNTTLRLRVQLIQQSDLLMLTLQSYQSAPP